MGLRNYSGSFITPVAITILFAVAVICLMLWGIYGAAGADSIAPCLTKEQARAKWPKEWLYWHTSHHCWDNVRGNANTANTADGSVKIIRAPKPNRTAKGSREDIERADLDANGNAVRHSNRTVKLIKGPSIFFPDLMSGPGVDDMMMRADSMSQWPVLMDVDAPPQFIPWQQRVSFLIQQEKP